MFRDLEAAMRSIFPWVASPTEKGQIEGNHRLTALTGSLLVPLLALIFFTGLFMDAWWHIHYAIGFVLIPVVVLKLATTGYRALRYYTGNPIYRAAGPPDMLSRVTAPFLALSVVTALATGVALFVEQSRHGVLSTLHTDAAISSALLLGNHFLTHAFDALATTIRELRTRLSRAAATRMMVASIALIIGIVLAIVTYSSGVWPSRSHDQQVGSGFSNSLPGTVNSATAAAVAWHEVPAAAEPLVAVAG
jgi:hypothetical protein